MNLMNPGSAAGRVLLFVLLVAIGQAGLGAPLYPPDSTGFRGTMRRLDSPTPNWGVEVHRINNLWLSITNGATFGIGFAGSELDPQTGRPAPSCEFPANSDVTYLYVGALWAGAVVGRDTLVSVGFDGNAFIREFWPQPGAEGAIVRRSNMRSSLDYSPAAVSEQDFICSYTDTFVDPTLTGTDWFDNRPHVPLGLEVTQRTYAWSYDYASDFVIFDFTMKNINRFPLKNVYFGIYADPDVYHKSKASGWMDDICGYVHSVPSPSIPCYRDTIRVAWTADNDGDPNSTAGDVFDFSSATSVTGTAVLRTPNPDLKYSYNWWVANGNAALDWGPRLAGTEARPFRDFRTGLGSPNGDRNKYYVMSNQEFDYDQLQSAINHSGDGFLPPTRECPNIADGFDTRYLFSFGPFDLKPEDTLPLTLAYVGGEGFHQVGTDYRDYWEPNQPQMYQKRLSYADLGANAKWAGWIFDNPGVDTDGDRDSGDYVWVCEWGGNPLCFNENEFPSDSSREKCRQVFTSGDGVPDFRGAAPPPAPVVRVIPGFGVLRVRWNGQISETNVDIFSGLKDFEGYRLYLGEDNRISDYVLLAAYDKDDYNLFAWDPLMLRWNISEAPLTRDSIESLFGKGFNPAAYAAPSTPYDYQGTYYYFGPQDWNSSALTDSSAIHRVYPEADRNDPTDTTEDGNRRYYEYEYVIPNLQPSKPYYVTVTAFDFGSRRIALSSLESALNLNSVLAYPLPSTGQVEAEGMSVGVYPNPYRIDGEYAAAGYENRDRTKSAERARALHFYNLPKICTIRIYTMAGDLIQQIEHNRPDGGPDAQQERWNLISRNTQAVVTGVYIYHVSSEMGEQVGKLVIIK